MLTELGESIDEHSENFNRELENTTKTQSKIKNSVTGENKQKKGWCNLIAKSNSPEYH